MSLAKIDQTDEMKLVFDVQVSGSKQNVSEYRLVIEAADYSIVCKGVEGKNGIEVQLPKLKGLLDEGVYKSTLEIIIGDRIFTPLTEVIEVNPNVEVQVESKTPVKNKNSDNEITVKVGKTVATSVVKEAKDKGYIVVDVKGRKALKNDKGYIGIIEGEEMIFSKTPHEFVTDLFEELKK